MQNPYQLRAVTARNPCFGARRQFDRLVIYSPDQATAAEAI
jgi:hypothetical protein